MCPTAAVVVVVVVVYHIFLQNPGDLKKLKGSCSLVFRVRRTDRVHGPWSIILE